jgi:hypothetical protein
MAGAVVVVVLAAAVLAVFIWLRAYAPLSALAGGAYRPGAGLGADIEPTFGSGGKTVYIPAYKAGRPFDTTFTLTNTGRFGVTVQGVVGDQAAPVSAAAILDPGDRRPIHGLRIEPHEAAIVVVRWQLSCAKTAAARAEATADAVSLRYGYLSTFTRTQSVVLPFAVTLRCHGGPLPSP